MRILSNDFYCNLPGSNEKVSGGLPRFAADFSRYAIDHGHEWIGLLRAKTPADGEAKKLLQTERAVYFSLNSTKLQFQTQKDFESEVLPEVFFKDDIHAFESIIHTTKPDIVFLNGLIGFMWLMYAAAKRSGVPIVFQHAGVWRREIDQYADLITDAARNLCLKMELDATMGVNVNVFLNTHSRDAFAESYNLREVPRSTIIPLPHAGWEFRPIKKPESSEKLTLGAVARWDRIKNHHAILALAEEIRARSLPWRIRVVTSVPDTRKHADMKRRYRELIDVVPPMDREVLEEFFSSLDIAILPSHFETAGGVVMEALATGVPTIISPHVGFVSEYREQGMHDWIIPFDDPGAVIERVIHLVGRADWDDIAELAKHIEICHNPETIYETYLRTFAAQATTVTTPINPETRQR